METISDPSGEIPVADTVDVLVVGGGLTGVAAAISAARLGARTLIIEQFNCLGGTATAGAHNHISQYTAWGSPLRIVGGISSGSWSRLDVFRQYSSVLFGWLTAWCFEPMTSTRML